MVGVSVPHFFVFVAIVIGISSANPGDTLTKVCQSYSIVGTVCIALVENPNCGIKVNVYVQDKLVVSNNMDVGVVPQLCLSSLPPPYNTLLSSCTDACIKIKPGATDPSQLCLSGSAKCGALPVEQQIGCFPKSNLSSILACQAARCPNDCSGHGTCQSGVCSCDLSWKGDDCSVQQLGLSVCRKFSPYGPFTVLACGSAELDKENCQIAASLSLNGISVGKPLTYPIHQLNAVFQNATCFPEILGCVACLSWDNLVLNESEAHGCGKLSLNCPDLQTWEYSLGCFTDNEIVSKCLGSCKPVNYCNYHGSCNKGNCLCDLGWKGTECRETATTSCINDCSGHGTCLSATDSCSCFSGYEGVDCSQAVQSSSSSSRPSAGVVVLIVFVVLLLLAGIGFAIYTFKKRRPVQSKFRQLELEEEDESLTAEFKPQELEPQKDEEAQD